MVFFFLTQEGGQGPREDTSDHGCIWFSLSLLLFLLSFHIADGSRIQHINYFSCPRVLFKVLMTNMLGLQLFDRKGCAIIYNFIQNQTAIIKSVIIKTDCSLTWGKDNERRVLRLWGLRYTERWRIASVFKQETAAAGTQHLLQC